LIWMKILHIFADSILLILILNVIVRPVNVLYIKNEFLTYEYPIPGILSTEQSELLKEKNFVSRFVYKLKYILSHQADGFWKRKMGVFVSLLFGIYMMGRKTQILGIWLTSIILIGLIITTLAVREYLKNKKKN